MSPSSSCAPASCGRPTVQTPVGGPAAWLCLPGLALVAVAAFLVTRLA